MSACSSPSVQGPGFPPREAECCLSPRLCSSSQSNIPREGQGAEEALETPSCRPVLHAPCRETSAALLGALGRCCALRIPEAVAGAGQTFVWPGSSGFGNLGHRRAAGVLLSSRARFPLVHFTPFLWDFIFIFYLFFFSGNLSPSSPGAVNKPCLPRPA